MAELTYRDAVARGIAQEMARDPDVVFLGEDVAKAGGVFKATVGLFEQFGPLRVRDTPISEQAILGAAMGAAMTGLKPIADVTAVEHPAADRAGAYNLEKVVIDGNDADEVYLTAVKFMNRARKGGGPALIEAMTYRHSGHSRADPAKYRPEGELEAWLKRDPVVIYKDRLLKLGVTDATLKDIEVEAMSKVDEATAAAKASPPPSVDDIEKNVWANGGSAWRN